MQIAHLGNFAAERPGQIDPLGWRGYGAARFRPIERQTGRNRKALLPPFAASQSRFRSSSFRFSLFFCTSKKLSDKKTPRIGIFYRFGEFFIGKYILCLT